MVFISVTRLRLRAFWYLPQFIRLASQSTRQAEQASGFLGGKLLPEASKAFWTITAWESEEAMRAYRNTEAHRRAMPKLLEWCDEASVAHWSQENPALPDWQEVHRRMLKEGRMSKVNHPSSSQIANQIASPRPNFFERTLKTSQPQR
jgi:quinol monooxygenase YgiN